VATEIDSFQFISLQFWELQNLKHPISLSQSATTRIIAHGVTHQTSVIFVSLFVFSEVAVSISDHQKPALSIDQVTTSALEEDVKSSFFHYGLHGVADYSRKE